MLSAKSSEYTGFHRITLIHDAEQLMQCNCKIQSEFADGADGVGARHTVKRTKPSYEKRLL